MWLQGFDVVYGDVVVVEQNIVLSNFFCCQQQVVIIVVENYQQFDVGIVWVVDYFDGWCFDWWMIVQEVWMFVVGGEDNGVMIWQFIEIDWELLVVLVGFVVESGGDYCCCLLLGDCW